MQRLEGEHTRLRVYIGEDDQCGGKPLYRAIVTMLRKEGLAGATVLRGLMGYGANSVLHTANLLRLSQDLPVVIEIVDSRENVDRILPKLDEMISEGMVTLERVGVLRYAPRKHKGGCE